MLIIYILRGRSEVLKAPKTCLESQRSRVGVKIGIVSVCLIGFPDRPPSSPSSVANENLYKSMNLVLRLTATKVHFSLVSKSSRNDLECVPSIHTVTKCCRNERPLIQLHMNKHPMFSCLLCGLVCFLLM